MVIVGLLSRRIPAVAANVALVLGFSTIALGYFVPWLAEYVRRMHEFHFLGAVFVLLVSVMLAIGWIAPRETPWQQKDSGQVDLTPWKPAVPLGLSLVAVVLAIYVAFADVSILSR